MTSQIVSERAWSDAVTAALVFAVDPAGTGVLVRARAGPVRDRWLGILRAALPTDAPLKHCPVHINDGRLLGGLDLDATLRAGKPVAERGLLADADGGVIVLAMAERLPSSTTAHLTAAMDHGETRVERDGVSLVSPARFGTVALDEGLDDEAAPAALRDRLAMYLDLDDIAWRETDGIEIDAADIAEARVRLPTLSVSDEQIEALCNVASALGIASLRAPSLALRVARAAAALAGHDAIEQDDIATAARLVFAPRATVFPSAEQDTPPEQPPPPEESADTNSDQDQDQQTPDIDRALDEVILAAARAAIPDDVLASLRAGAMRSRGRGAGKSGAMQKSKTRGRPTGTRRGDLRGGKLNIIETLRAAAPWQSLRRREADARLIQDADVLHTSPLWGEVAAKRRVRGSEPLDRLEPPHPNPLPQWERERAADGATSMISQSREQQSSRIIVRPDDFRITRFRQRSETATIFLVDASGSAALHRLAEAKGAVELLLADCYVRRDQVALIAFRGALADILLPPTRSLTRAKRSLAGLPGGGGTPLAAGLDAAFTMADAIRRKGQTPSIVVLTDGRANIARDGTPGRPRAEQDATAAAQALQAAGIATVLVDTSPRPGPSGAQLAKNMGARYLPLPYADAGVLAKAVKTVVG